MSADLEPVPSSAAPVIVVGGGQSGLAAARALRELRMPTVILEASDRPAGSWPRYYDSLRLFSPAEYSSMPGMPFPGAPDRYPGRDEVAGYLERYAARLGVEIQTSTRVQAIRQDGREFIVVTEDGRALRASGIVAASGSFSNPYRPSFPGEEAFTGELSHVAGYRNPAPYAGQRVIVVGAGDSAAQVANELAPVATVTLASRHPVRFIPQRLGGQDIHYWLRETGFDTLPAEWLSKITGGSVVTDSAGFQQTLADGLVDRRPMFTALDRETRWSGATASASRPTRSSWPPDTGPAWGTCASSAPSTLTGLRSTSRGSPPRMSAWSTSAWNTSARLPPTPSGASAMTPGR